MVDTSLEGIPDATEEDVLRMELEIVRGSQTAINELHRVIIVAEVLAEWYRTNVKGTIFEAFFAEAGWGGPMSEPSADELSRPVESIEVAGVLGMYTALSKERSLNVLFANDLAQEIHGLDAVMHDPARDRFILVESKGTTRSLKAPPGSYLGKTKRKGRQMSTDWCWHSLKDFAAFATTAPIFLRVLGPFLDSRCERLMVVTEATKVDCGYRFGDSVAFDEVALQQALGSDETVDYNEQRRWLAEIRAAGQFPEGNYKWPTL